MGSTSYITTSIQNGPSVFYRSDPPTISHPVRSILALIPLIIWSSVTPTFAEELASDPPESSTTQAVEIYHQTWIDLNKNGTKDPYEDSSVSVAERIEDLLVRMTLDEKTCQMATLYGYPRVLKDEFPTENWLIKLWMDGIGNIDEHANGNTNYGAPIEAPESDLPHAKHTETINLVQRFFIERTRLGIPVDPGNLSLYNKEQKWVVEPGDFTVWIGPSSTDLHLEGSFEIDSRETPLRVGQDYLPGAVSK